MKVPLNTTNQPKKLIPNLYYLHNAESIEMENSVVFSQLPTFAKIWFFIRAI
jgi:hypothetical protein